MTWLFVTSASTEGHDFRTVYWRWPNHAPTAKSTIPTAVKISPTNLNASLLWLAIISVDPRPWGKMYFAGHRVLSAGDATAQVQKLPTFHHGECCEVPLVSSDAAAQGCLRFHASRMRVFRQEDESPRNRRTRLAFQAIANPVIYFAERWQSLRDETLHFLPDTLPG